MSYLNAFIRGVPYGQVKVRGDIEGPRRWSQAIKAQTANLPKVKEACLMKVTFLLPADKFPSDCPYGNDLDNLLNETIFADAPGRDSCVISLTAMKSRVVDGLETGAELEVLPVSIGC